MKKILSIVLVVLITIISSVQSNAQTLKFLGIPVDGRKSEVIALLKNKGFVYDSVGLVNLDPNTNNTNYSNILQF